MNQFFAGGAALITALILWGLGRRPRATFLKSDFGNSLNYNQSNQISLIASEAVPNKSKSLNCSTLKLGWKPPSSAKDQLSLRKELFQLINSGPEQRLQAITFAGIWGHRSILSILRRGLKDSDSRVVHAAAKAIQKHKKGLNFEPLQEDVRPPRNVALMR